MSKKISAYHITMDQIGENLRNLRYMSKMAIPGIYSILSWNYGLGRSQEVIDGMKEAIYDFVSSEKGNIELTFDSEESYEWWNGLCDEWFEQPRDNYEQSDYSGDLGLKKEHQLKGYLFEE